ncbi:olfactory receptor 2G3-like [Tachyglossus aculeatus]|uniref:olfactory receptor 2G3-like n=1 Tax=Tachyglossus aculeatus TaxID=9261 RepID=UPI0018F4ED2C|nr:olfactory receptor 2G3-like [Tachyglossus aculeatus]
MVIVFIFTRTVAHLKPPSNSFSTLNLLSSLFYIMVSPILNPLIYSLRNQDMKTALRRVLGFFLFQLSLMYLCFTTSIVPQLLWNLQGHSKNITMVHYAVQLYVSLALGSTECILLVVMALDHHNAICRLLHYTTFMHSRLLRALVGLAWMGGVGDTAIQATVIFHLPHCGHRRLPHFLCEMPAMLKMAYVDVRANEIQLLVGTLVLILLPLSLITVSHGSNARAVLRIKSPWVWKKALGTCGSHLLVVTLFYESITVVYIWPNSSFSGILDMFLTLFYTVVTPTLNPLI